MSFRTTLVIGLLLLAALGAYLLMRSSGEHEPKQTTMTIGDYFAIPNDRISKLRLSYAGDMQAITLEKRGDKWYISEPINAYANQGKVRSLINDIVNKKLRMRFSASNLAQYGLDNPRITVEVWLQNSGDKPHKVFRLGNRGIELSVYAKEDSEDSVFTIDSYALDDFTKSPSDLRERRIMRVDGEVDSISISTNRNETLSLKKTDGKWIVNGAPNATGNTDRIEEFLDKLGRLSVSIFEDDDPKSLLQYGLDRPRVEIEIGGDFGQRRLLIGNANEASGRTYVKIADQNYVYAVESSELDEIVRLRTRLRDRRLLDFQRSEANQIVITNSFGRIELRKGEEGKWRVVKPSEFDANIVAVNDLLFDLDSLEASEFIADSPTDLAQYGLTNPSLTVEVMTRDDPTPSVIRVGKRSDSGFFAQGTRSQAIGIISDRDYRKLNRRPIDFHSKLIWDYPTSDIAKITLRQGDSTIELTRKGYEWHIVQPVQEKARRQTMNDFLSHLRKIEALDFIDDRIGKIDLEISFQMTDGSEKRLSLDEEDERGIRAQATGIPAPFLLPKEKKSGLNVKLDDLRGD